MERYLVFAGIKHYPLGGWGDYIGTFTTKIEAMACLKGRYKGDPSLDWSQIIDTQGGGFDVYLRADFIDKS